jgi:hypothetical protein
VLVAEGEEGGWEVLGVLIVWVEKVKGRERGGRTYGVHGRDAVEERAVDFI